VGAGPNGLAAGITLAREGLSVLLLEQAEAVGGGLRSAPGTLPGFVHDICAAIHPMALSSPFFRSLDLGARGLAWVHSPAALAHPLDDGTAVMLQSSVEATSEGLGADGPSFARLLGPLAARWDDLAGDILGPPSWPRHPALMARFGRDALRSAASLARDRFRTVAARALFAGLAAHSVLPLERPTSAAFGLVMGAAGLAVGWPCAQGGSQGIARALAGCFQGLGGEIRCGFRVRSASDLPRARAVLFDLTPRNLASVGEGLFPPGFLARLGRHPVGPGVFKIDWALDTPIPWRAPGCLRAATVHVGGTLEEIAEGERMVWQGRAPRRPFVLLAQQSLFDGGRAPRGRHTAWAYCHVPNGSGEDMTGRIEAQVERFAPGFGRSILARSVWTPQRMEEHNPNYTGGDFLGGRQDLLGLLFRPLGRWRPYRTPVKGVYICSSAMPPGGGVHGMCGHGAACAVLRDLGLHGQRRVEPPG
jgi:phytoene dehydrogenase-like protein